MDINILAAAIPVLIKRKLKFKPFLGYFLGHIGPRYMVHSTSW